MDIENSHNSTESDPPNNNVNNSPGLFLLESFGVPGGNAGDAFSNKKYLTDEEREKLNTDKRIHVKLLDIIY